jgi:hypothetical protein
MPTDTSSPDPIPEPSSERKKPRRLALYLPFGLLAVALVGYAAYWAVASQRLGAAIDERANALRSAGYVVELSDRRVGGFPFRLKVGFGEARIASPSGWALAVPGLEAEAYTHDLGHWVVVAPEGLTFTRPGGGPVEVRGDVRGSIAGVSQVPWRIVLQGRKVSLTTPPGARPFSLASADLVELYLRPSPRAGEGMALFRVENGRAQAGSLLGQIGGDGVVQAALDARIAKPAAFQGGDWGQAVQAWRRAGGVLNQVQGTASAGTFAAKAGGGTLGVGPDGRLVGAVPLELKQADKALSALAGAEALDPTAAGSAAAVAAARAQGEAATVNLVFQAGVTTFGPVKVGPSPKVG